MSQQRQASPTPTPAVAASAAGAPVDKPVEVLIARGDVAIATALAERFETAGIPTASVSHGVQCLESALSQCPRIVVAELGLPLLDASRLAEILRANPRTQAVRFVFIGAPSDLANGGGVGDLLVPADAEVEEVVAAVDELLERQTRVDRLRAMAEQGEADEGEIEQLPLVELLQLLNVSALTRIVAVTRQCEGGGEQSGGIEVVDGEVVQALVDQVEGEKALFRMLAWQRGRFAIETTEPTGAAQISTPTRALLKEGLRQIAERERHAASLPALDAQIKLSVPSSDLPQIVHPLTQEVLLLTELYRTVGEVVDHCGFPDYQVLRTLRTLAERGIIAIGRAHLGEGEAAEGLFNEQQQRRVSDWMRESGCELPARAKLLVVASEHSLVADFTNVLRGTPSVKLSPELERGQLGPCDLLSLGDIDVDDRCEIELLHLPAAPDFAALWPRAAHGALGVMLLLGAPVAHAREQLEAFSKVLRSVPRARVFHVVLLPKGEHGAADELRENLALLDDASLFLLPIDQAKDPAPLLRSLFARLVP